MHKLLEAYARRLLQINLSRCSSAQTLLFRRMYAAGDLHQPLDKIVEKIPTDKLEIALDQVVRTLAKHGIEPRI